MHGALEIATLDAVLHADVARVVLAVNEGCAAGLVDVGELAQRDLLSCGRADQQIANLAGVLTELRLHAHDKVEELLTLNHLRCGLTSDGSLYDRFDVSDVDTVACDFIAVDIDEQAGLA